MELYGICAEDFGEDLRKSGIVVDWMLLGSGGNFVIRYFKNLKGKEWSKAKTGMGKEEKVVHIIQDRVIFGYFCS